MASKFRGLWRKHVVQWKESGLSQRDYAQQHGLLPETLSSWIERAKKLPANLMTAVEVCPLVVTRSQEKREATVASPSLSTVGIATLQGGSIFELRHVRGWSLAFPCDTSIKEVAQLLKELQ